MDVSESLEAAADCKDKHTKRAVSGMKKWRKGSIFLAVLESLWHGWVQDDEELVLLD